MIFERFVTNKRNRKDSNIGEIKKVEEKTIVAPIVEDQEEQTEEEEE